MSEKDTNKKALEFLTNRDWHSAQKLLFENASRYKSHNSYNNLGYYLVTEGMICKDGKFLNTYNLGMKYLLKAAQIKDSATNAFAIVSALNYKIRNSSSRKKTEICDEAIKWLKKGLSIKNSKEMRYNLLRFLYLTDPKREELIRLSEDVVKDFLCEESISLRLEILRTNRQKVAGLECIEKHRELLDEIDLLMFYTTVGLYEMGFALCESVCLKFSIDKYIASAMIECCVKTNHLNEAEIYASVIQENDSYVQYEGKKNWCSKVFGDSSRTKNYRQKMISDYCMTPPFITECCYFGCDMHNTPW